MLKACNKCRPRACSCNMTEGILLHLDQHRSGRANSAGKDPALYPAAPAKPATISQNSKSLKTYVYHVKHQDLQPTVAPHHLHTAILCCDSWSQRRSCLTERQVTSMMSRNHTLIKRRMHRHLPAVLRFVSNLFTVCAPEQRAACMTQPVPTSLV